MKQVIFITAMLLSAAYLNAQTNSMKPKKTKELVFLAGTIQPFLLKGGNFEVDLYHQKMVFNYSHGFSLELENSAGTTVGEAKRQSVAYHLPYSTGFGVGYRLNKYFDIRFEPKFHRFQGYYDGTDRKQSINQLTDYNTITLGVGAYFRWKPFEKQNNFLKGIFTSTSVRYWQNIRSSLANNEYKYFNKVTNQNETLKTSNIGIANTPFILNVALGYSIMF
ncbi:hypothetical protein [Flavobacterium filum]|uniref:hypothetical protein n=1 Tax=Flavobacterium filum TaxID=370974 RepID=UPI0023F57D91|nr:hypothetical protein [Flavobacterium filum]